MSSALLLMKQKSLRDRAITGVRKAISFASGLIQRPIARDRASAEEAAGTHEAGQSLDVSGAYPATDHELGPENGPENGNEPTLTHVAVQVDQSPERKIVTVLHASVRDANALSE